MSFPTPIGNPDSIHFLWIPSKAGNDDSDAGMTYVWKGAAFVVPATFLALMVLYNSDKDNPFDLLLVDIQMSKTSGTELIDEMNKNCVIVPIFAVSGLTEGHQIVA